MTAQAHEDLLDTEASSSSVSSSWVVPRPMTDNIGFGLGSFLVSLSLDLLDDDLALFSSSEEEDDGDLARLEAPARRSRERERDLRERERERERRERLFRDLDLDRRRSERSEADDEEPPARLGERRRSSRRSSPRLSLDFPASRRASSRSRSL